MHQKPLLWAALLCAALSVTEAQSPPPPLCRVTATYTPVSWPTWTPLEKRFGRITIQLRPGCPPNGEARVHLTNPASGRRLPEHGTYRLTPDQPRRDVPGKPPLAVTTPGWVVYWHARSGKTHAVKQTLSAPQGGAP